MIWILLAALQAPPAVEESSRIVRGADGALSLEGDLDRFLPPADPGRWDVVTDLVVFRDRLLGTSCMDFDETSMYVPSAYSDGAEILEYDPAKGEWVVLREQKNSMLFNARVVGGRLLLPEYFPFQDCSRYIHAYDGREWSRIGPLEAESWHIMDVLAIGDRLYASGSWRDTEPGAPEQDPRWHQGYGRLYESRDGGTTWTLLRRTAQNGRILDMVEFRGRLFANERGERLIAWDGEKWEEIPVRFPKVKVDAKLGSAHLTVFADRLLAINADLYYVYDGKEWRSHTPGFLDLWREKDRIYGLRESGHIASSADGEKWSMETREPVPAAEFDRQAPMGRPLHRGAVAYWRGRLAVGTCAEGRLYLSPVKAKGSAVLEPREAPLGGGGDLVVDAAVQEGARLRVQVRTAKSREDLKRVPWRGPEGKGSAYAGSGKVPPPPKDHAWIQFKVELESDPAGRVSPLVRSVTFVPE